MPKKPVDTALTPGCVIPTTPDARTIRGALHETTPLGRSARDEREIIEYVEWQCSKGAEKPVTVNHCELVKSERVLGRDYRVWDVHASDGRWWVVTNPTNLYSHTQFPSLDYTLSFHIGLMARIAHRDHRGTGVSNQDRFAGAWRRWEQASEGIDRASEAEDFQAIGMKCRECLLAFARAAQDDISVPTGTAKPKRGDFIGWSDIIAEWTASGEPAKEIRAHLKRVAASTWQLVSWLTHAANAVPADAELAVSATNYVLASFAEAIMRRESARPDRCPQCSSYQVRSYYAPELDRDPPYMLVCGACSWQAPATQAS